MWALSYAGLGWVVGTAAPTSDRRLRMWCAALAAAPEIAVFAKHDVAGHNLFAGFLCVGAAAVAFRTYAARSWISALGWVALTFVLHMVLDVAVFGGILRLFWPLDPRGRAFQGMFHPEHPASYLIAYGFLVL